MEAANQSHADNFAKTGVPKVNLGNGSYKMTVAQWAGKSFNFSVIDGGFLEGDVEGNVQDGKLVAHVDGWDLQGAFDSQTAAVCSGTGPNGESAGDLKVTITKA